VIGGGIAGLSAAQALSDMALEVVLVEKTAGLGGLLQQVHHLETGASAETALAGIVADVVSRDNITCHTRASVKEISGYIGNYAATIDTEQGQIKEEAGCIVVATGAVPLTPDGLYGYNGQDVICLMELEQRLKKNEFAANRVTFIQCAGARTREKEYCSRICCMIGVKNALLVKEKFPLTEVRVLYRDMQMYGTQKEQMLWDARGRGIHFDVYSPDNAPRVENGKIRFSQAITGKTVELDTDLVVLSTPLVPRKDAAGLANMLRVPTDQNGFFLEAHAKLRPLDFAADGIFVCGSGRYPATSTEARTQGLGVASRVGAILFKEKLVKSAIVARINPDACVGCLACLPMCPYEAITYNREKRICEINEVLCKGCGNCAATCPSHSAQLSGFKPAQLLAQIGAA
jgi:heterodisulfide reductase subunit A